MNDPARAFSIILVHWKRRDLLLECLDALARQTIRGFRLVVVDNGNQPALTDDLTDFGFDVEIIRNETNIGFAAAVNQAVAQAADSDWIALLNPDAFPEPDWLEQMATAIARHPGEAAFASRQLSAGDPRRLDGTGDSYHVTGAVWRRGHGRRAEADFEIREVFSACAAASVFRRDAWLSAGGFDPDFFCYLEDVDLGFRLRLLGYRCLLVPAATVRHVGSATTGGPDSETAVYYGQRNLVWTFVKNMPGVLFWSLLPMHVAMNLVAVAVLAARGRGRAALRAKRDALRALGPVLEKRRQIQMRRAVSVRAIWLVLDKRLFRSRRD